MKKLYLALLLPFVGLLWLPLYDRTEPALLGFPFFYWYQLVWVPLTSLLVWVVWKRAAR
ncbi:DUF3311 domain-containing protein [Gluconacetobacter sacchari]|uniref:DUF3311 domain-containing protein n=1 Tax=Gluconacetobacter sacchari TaxID=92759 RepID=UPI0039B5E8F8